MPKAVPARDAVAAFVLIVGLTVVRAGVLIRPDEYLRMKLNYTLQNLVEQPPDRCRPEPEDVAVARSIIAECNLLYGSVPYQGECHRLLERGPCSANHWIVLDKKTERATCEFQVCSNHQVLVAGGCTRLGRPASDRHCPETQQLIINEYGEAECECPMGRVYHSSSKKCYDPYEQGPCEEGDMLQVIEKDGKVSPDCVPSLCSTPDQVPMTSKCELAKFSETTKDDGSYKCYRLSSPGPCSNGFLALDRTMLDVVCTMNQPYGVFDFLTGGSPCMLGSLRDSMRDCRRMMPRSVPEPVINTLPTVKPGAFGDGNVCPPDYVFLAGSCLHTVSGH